MMTMQTPQTTWNPTAPITGANGHSTRIADVFGGVTTQGYALTGMPTPVVNPFYNNYAHDVTAINPYAVLAAQLATNPYAVNPLALNPFVAMNPFACPTAAFGSFVNPLVPTFHALPNVFQSPLALNPFATINPFASVNPFAPVNPFVGQPVVNPHFATLPHLTPTINPFINPLTTPVANYVNPLATPTFGTTLNPYVTGIQPTINTMNTIPGVATTPFANPAFVPGVMNPFMTNLTGIPNTPIVNPLIANSLTTHPYNTVATPNSCFQGVHPFWTGAFPGVTHPGAAAFPCDPFLTNGFAAGIHPGLGRGLYGANPFQAIHPYLTNAITQNPFVTNNPYVTNPYIANTIAATTALNPLLRATINHPYASACGLNPLGATFGVC